MPITTLSKKTNSLQNIGDFITIRTELPLEPKLTKVLGFYITTNDVLDNKEQIQVSYYILPISRITEVSDSDIINNFTVVDKSNQSSYNKFINDCNSCQETYLIWFKIEKITSINKFLTIDKFSLQLQNVSELRESYPFYDNSIFKDKLMYDENTLRWSYNVLEKIDAVGSILPTYINKNTEDFTTFWGSITHFFGIIINYGRQFRDFLKDENLFSLFLEQKDYYRDRRGGVFTDIILNSNQKLTYTIKPNTRMSLTGEIENVEGYSCSNLISIRENNYLYLTLDNIDQTLYFKSQNKTYKGSIGNSDTLIYEININESEGTKDYYFRIFVEEASTLKINSSTISLVKGYNNIVKSIEPGNVKFYLKCSNGCNYEFIQLKSKEEYLEALDIDNEINKLFGNFEYEIDVCFFNDKKEFVVQNSILLSKYKLNSWFYIEKGQNISYVAFSYSIPKQLLVKLTAYGEGDINIKNYSAEELLSVYSIFKNRGTIHSNNAIKKICETKQSDTFFGDYLKVENSCCVLDKGNGFSEMFRKPLTLSEFVPSKIIPLYNGEFVEFNQNFVYFTNNNSIKVKIDYDSLNEYNDDITDKFLYKILIYISLYSDNYIYYQGNLLTKNGSGVNCIEIDNIPNTVTEFDIPINCIQEKKFYNISEHLTKLDYFKDIYLFTKKAQQSGTPELKYLQVKAIFVIPSQLGFNSNYLLGYRIVENNRLQGLVVNSLNISTRTVVFTYTYTAIDEILQSSTKIKSVTIKYTSNDEYQGYVKVFINDDYLKGLFIFDQTSFSSQSISIPISKNITRVFSQSDNDINSFDSIAEFMDKNVASDWGNAFSYYYKPWINYGKSSRNDSNLNEYTTSDVGGLLYTGLNKFKIRQINCYYCLRKIAYGFNFLDIKNYYFVNYRNHGKFTNTQFEEIVSQKFLPYQGFRVFENVEKDNLLYVAPLRITNVDVTIISKTLVNWYITWLGGYPLYTIYIYRKNDEEEYEQIQKVLNRKSLNYSYNFERGKIYKIVIEDSVGITVSRENIYYTPIEAIGFNYKLNILSGNETEVSNKNIKGIYDDLYLSPTGGVSPYKITYVDYKGVTKNIFTTAKHYARLKDFPFLRKLSGGEPDLGQSAYSFTIYNAATYAYNYFAVKIPAVLVSKYGSGVNIVRIPLNYHDSSVDVAHISSSEFGNIQYIPFLNNTSYSTLTFIVDRFDENDAFFFKQLTYIEYQNAISGASQNSVIITDSLGESKTISVEYNKFYSAYDNGEGSCLLEE